MKIYKIFKRLFDIIVSFLGLAILWPLMIVIAIIIRIDSPGPAIFRQRRLGKNKKEFTILKFRSMVVNDFSDSVMASDANDSRITAVGAFIRKTSIDELPQLLNIFVGHMSIIGPRPMLPAEYELFSEQGYDITTRFDIRPGLFCTIDVEYRAEASEELQFRYDKEYVENYSFIGDIKCFFGVLKAVLKQKGIYKTDKTQIK